MAEALSRVDYNDPEVAVGCDVTAHAVDDPNLLRTLRVVQITGSVRWRESVEFMAHEGVTEIWEIGAGKALIGMVRRINRDIATRAIGTPEDVKAAAEALAG